MSRVWVQVDIGDDRPEQALENVALQYAVTNSLIASDPEEASQDKRPLVIEIIDNGPTDRHARVTTEGGIILGELLVMKIGWALDANDQSVVSIQLPAEAATITTKKG